VITKRLVLNFTEDTAAQPIIFNLGQQFDITTNIVRADMTESGGTILVEITGAPGDIEAGIEFAISRGVRVEEAFG